MNKGMSKAPRISAGLLLFRRGARGLEVFLAHMGGPFWAKKDAGVWTIPKGELDGSEELLAAAQREFEEETGVQPRGPFIALGRITQKSGKVVHGWAWEGDADLATITSNRIQIEWPKGSGRWIECPEVDRCAWFDPATAREKINPAQIPFIERLEAALA
jgi:predicted NUDIX family NTP pyrophosphohydrolase